MGVADLIQKIIGLFYNMRSIASILTLALVMMLQDIKMCTTIYRKYTNPRSGCDASRYQNVYYHLKRSCVKAVRGVELTKSDIIIPDALKPKLTFAREFGVNL